MRRVPLGSALGVRPVPGKATRRQPLGASFVDPSSLSNLIIWLKADELGLADNAPVASWPDDSGLAHDFGQATAGARPVLKTNQINGLPVVRFDGVDDLLTCPDFAYTRTGLSAFVVVKRVGGTNPVVFAHGDSTLNERAFLMQNLASGSAMGVLVSPDGGVATGKFYLGPTNVASGFHLWSFTYGAGALSLWVDGNDEVETKVFDAATAQLFDSPTALSLGAIFASGSATSFLSGDIAEVIAYDRELTATERNNVEAYIATKYALAIA